jgi:hypothetical protein
MLNTNNPNAIDVSWNIGAGDDQDIIYFVLQYRIVPSGKAFI